MAMAATIPPGGVFELICSKSENLRPCREDPYRWLQDMSFRHATIAQSAGTAFLGRCFRPTLSCPPFSHREREQRAKEVRDASFDAICRCHLAICDGIFLHPCSERSGPIAFARSLPAAAKSPDQKLDAAAAAIKRVAGLKQDYQQRIAAAAPADQERTLNEAVNAMSKAVTEQGLSVEEYDSILEVAQNDPDIREKIRQRIRPSAQ